MDNTKLKEALGQFCSGVTIVTSSTDGAVHGMTVSAFTSVSLFPPLVLVCINKQAKMHDLLIQGEKFGISVLEESQADVCQSFAGRGSGESFQFDEFENVLVLNDALTTFTCSKYQQHNAGDHTIFVGQIINFITRSGAPLVYHAGKFGSVSAQTPNHALSSAD